MRFVASSLLVLSLAPAVAAAQAKRASPTEPASRQPSRTTTTDPAADVPRDMIPPAGKCRIWMRGVPAAQQPAPTDCTTALRQAPSNGVLVFGPALRDLSPFETRRNESRAQQLERERQTAVRSGRDSGGGRANDSSATRRPSTATERGTKATARGGSASDPKPRDPTPREAKPRDPTPREAKPRDPPPAPRQSRRPDRPE